MTVAILNHDDWNHQARQRLREQFQSIDERKDHGYGDERDHDHDSGNDDRRRRKLEMSRMHQSKGSSYMHNIAAWNSFSPNLASTTKCVGLSSQAGGFVAVDFDGRVTYQNIPTELLMVLLSVQLEGVDQVSIGSRDQFVVLMRDGSAFFGGGCCADLQNQINIRIACGLKPELVVFGSNDSWFAKFRDGSCVYRNVPKQLQDYCRTKGAVVEFVWLSENGEGFVVCGGGRCFGNSDIAPLLPAAAHAALIQGSATEFFLMERNATFFLRHKIDQ
ncbi:hypothetical protein BDR26DRAFT_938030 [Obelidium mucronatum]|nr:hypothetical protein BDR26DRAFT_938030 [Obelidium mucronatum]